MDDWKVATPTRGVMGDDGFIEEAPYELIDYEDDPAWQQKKGWYKAPLGARALLLRKSMFGGHRKMLRRSGHAERRTRGSVLHKSLQT